MSHEQRDRLAYMVAFGVVVVLALVILGVVWK